MLRIISMLMIVFHHFAVHGEFNWNGIGITIPHLWYNVIAMGGKIGVDVFILITGYFLILNNNFSFKRILLFLGEVFTYSVLIGIIFLMCAPHTNYGLKTILRILFPITFEEWWFASAYFVLYLIHPFINILLNSLEKHLYQQLLIILIIIWSIIPTLTNSTYEGNCLTWFITLYAIAGYIRIYGLNKDFNTKIYFRLWMVFSLLTYFTSIILCNIGVKWTVISNHTTYFFGQQKITTLLISITLFMMFVTWKIDDNKWINLIASATFGVYLIHDNDFVRTFIWKDLLRNAQYQESILLIPYSIMSVLFVYIICTIVDLIRQRIIEKPYKVLVYRYADKIIKYFERIIIVIRQLFFGK